MDIIITVRARDPPFIRVLFLNPILSYAILSKYNMNIIIDTSQNQSLRM